MASFLTQLNSLTQQSAPQVPYSQPPAHPSSPPQAGGAKKVSLCGRQRNVIIEGRNRFVIIDGKKVGIAKAREMDKKYKAKKEKK